MAQTKRYFVLTMTGINMPLTLKGIYTPRMILRADSNNLQPIYVGTRFENGDGANGMRQLTADNNLMSLGHGQSEEFANIVQDDRLPRMRNIYLENNRLHVMSEWFASGQAGDVLFVEWWDEGNGFIGTDNQPIDISTSGLSR